MATYTNYRLPIPEARALASLESIRQDLIGVIDYCDRLERLKSEPYDPLIWEALCAAVVVKYARCFSPGARDYLRHDLLEGASSEQRSLHEYVIDVRSKHVAHSVNGFEETEVTVLIREDDDTIHSLSAAHGSVVGLAYHMPLLIRGLAGWVLGHVQREAAAHRPALLEAARLLGAATVKAFGPPVLGRVAVDDDPSRKRSRP